MTTDPIAAARALIEQVRRQINLHLGSPDPDCLACRGTGREDWAYLGIVRCRLCWVVDAT